MHTGTHTVTVHSESVRWTSWWWLKKNHHKPHTVPNTVQKSQMKRNFKLTTPLLRNLGRAHTGTSIICIIINTDFWSSSVLWQTFAWLENERMQWSSSSRKTKQKSLKRSLKLLLRWLQVVPEYPAWHEQYPFCRSQTPKRQLHTPVQPGPKRLDGHSGERHRETMCWQDACAKSTWQSAKNSRRVTREGHGGHAHPPKNFHRGFHKVISRADQLLSHAHWRMETFTVSRVSRAAQIIIHLPHWPRSLATSVPPP